MAKNVIAGRYELIEKIGDGGMAVVYKAKCRVLNRLVAIKILKPEFIEDEKFIKNFRKESLAAASLSHPNIVSIYDVGREGNIYYIVMELVEGETLSEKIHRQGHLEVDEALSITKNIARGLAAAHKRNVVHRDVKPHNILITSEGIPKIADFGIAKATTDTTIVDKTSETIMGSVHYFSPEQARGKHMDARTDIYSLGIVLYEMLTGEVPFDGENPVSVALMQINKEMPYPSELNPDIPIEVEEIIMHATEKQPAERYQSAEEMIEDIERYEHGYRVDPKLAAGGYKPKNAMEETRVIDTEQINDRNDEIQEQEEEPKKPRKKKKPIWLIILIIALLLGGGFAAAYFSGMLGGRNVEVPDIVGMSIEEAEAEAQKVGLSVHVDDQKYSEDAASDTVLEQDPEGGAEVKKGTTINVVVSIGSAKRVVPNVIDMKKDTAKKTLEDAGFKVDFREKESEPDKKGVVIDQTPNGGSEANIDDTVVVYIGDGKGKKMVTVPNILGMSLEDAKDTLKEKNLVLEHIGEGVSSEYAEGEVMSQSYGAGEEVEEQTTIKVRTSKGAVSTKSYYIDYGPAKRDNFKLTVKVKDSDGSRTLISSEERDKNNEGETINVQGRGNGTITVLFDGEVVAEQNLNFSEEDVN